MTETVEQSVAEPPAAALKPGPPESDALWWLLVAGGVLSILFGIAVFAWPGATLLVLAVLVGFWLIAAGVFRLVAAFAPTGASTGYHILSGIVGILFLTVGIICLRNLVTSLTLLAVVVALNWLLAGAVELANAAAVPGPDRVARAVLGALGVVVGIVLLAWPGLTLSLVIMLTGLGATLTGAGQIAFALYARRRVATA